MLQTLGWVNRGQHEEPENRFQDFGLIIFAGFVSVPISVLAGWVR